MRIAVALLAVVLLPFSATAGSARDAELHAGDAVFWVGPLIESSAGSESFVYRLEVKERAARLRIGFDHPEVGDTFDIGITPPGRGETNHSVGPGIYSDEFNFSDPEVGTWRIEVVAEDVTDSAFRVRAKLEEHLPSLGTDAGPVLPNLQVLPPHEASFLFPLTNGSADSDPTGLDVGGAISCHPEEYAQDDAFRCLRFAFGVRNTGRGPLDLFHEGSSQTERELFQRVYQVGGGYKIRPAGTAVFHETHGHWHHSEAVAVQLFAVGDPDEGSLEPAGAKRTKGFAHRNELLRDWDVFYPTNMLAGFGLRPGWADIYEWDRPGNYIDFGINGDGYYVVRMWADPVDGIAESNERDNRAYTYMKITGSEVELLEAGRGRDPWDPCKIVVGFGGHPDPERGPRPNRCPPDTT